MSALSQALLLELVTSRLRCLAYFRETIECADLVSLDIKLESRLRNKTSQETKICVSYKEFNTQRGSAYYQSRKEVELRV